MITRCRTKTKFSYWELVLVIEGRLINRVISKIA